MDRTAVPTVLRPRLAVVLMLTSLWMGAGAGADAQAKHDGPAPAVAASTSAQPVTTLLDLPTTIALDPSTPSSETALPEASTTAKDSPNVYAATGVDGFSAAVSNDKPYAYVPSNDD